MSKRQSNGCPLRDKRRLRPQGSKVSVADHATEAKAMAAKRQSPIVRQKGAEAKAKAAKHQLLIMQQKEPRPRQQSVSY